MQLCQLCQSISFASLPVFPEDDRHAVAIGGSNVVVLIAKPGDSSGDATTAEAVESQKIKHHADLDSLREAAAGGCGLCVLILGEADALLVALGELGDEGNPDRVMYPMPSFDMWLTKGLDGRDGFWVVSGPRDSKPPTPFKMLLLVAALGFVVDKGDPMASVIRGRPVKATVDSELLERVTHRLTDCDQVHVGCQRPGEVVPQKLLDLHAPTPVSDDSVNLVDLGPTARVKYAALSYASERGIARCLDTDAADSNGISVAALPKTFRDAILVTRSLGLQYLWIDSLCIPGNLEEWRRSSPEAGAVYANAYVTISATGTSDTFQGLFTPRAEHKYAHIPYVSETGDSGTVLAVSLPRSKEVQREQHIQMRDEPASAGVWSFQERVLSPRVVHFGSDQVYVECTREFVSEDGLCETASNHTTMAKLPAGAKDYRLASTAADPSERWFSSIDDYATRKAANPTDRLDALANVARAFQPMMPPGQGREYLAGHWRNSLVKYLCWQSPACTPAGDSSTPSWSWASVEGQPVTRLVGKIVDQYYATVVKTHVEPANAANPFGAVKSASITLEAPLIPLRLLEQHEMPGNSHPCRAERILLRVQGADSDITPHLDTMEYRFSASAEALRSMELYALVLFRSHTELNVCLGTCPIPEAIFHVLIVTPAANGGMRRLGFTLAVSSDLGPASLLDSRETVNLV